MNASELEQKYLSQIHRVGSVLLLPSEEAVRLLDDCLDSEIRFLGVEAFRLFPDGRIQPAMEFSNIRFGKVEESDGNPESVEFKRSLRSPWRADPTAIKRTKALILEGSSNGYSWYEVSLEDPTTDELLFFRSIEIEQ